MFSRHTIWCVLMFTALAVTVVVAKPASDVSLSNDECHKSNMSCTDPNSVCVNKEGTYICMCKHGYFDLDGGLCLDIDECCTTDIPCSDIGTQCVNTEGSYTCGGCKEGYIKQEGGGCHDIDECHAKNDTCSAPHTHCVNIEGSYACPCAEGYVKVEGTCHDIDECCTTDNVCLDPRTVCVNTEGSYTCECKDGYTKLDGGFCHDIDECRRDNDSCPDPGSKCFNIEGSYICLCREGLFKLEGTCIEPNNSICAQLPNHPPRVVIPSLAGLNVLCDTATDGGGWIVFQRRVNGSVDFYRNWTAYKQGFGDFDTNFWLGNEIIHLMTAKRQHELRIDMTFKGKSYFVQYDTFSIESEDKKYTLRLGAFSSKSNTRDNLSFHNGQAFSTFDRDNDSIGGVHCAVKYHGAWWYKGCHQSNLNGHWGNKTNSVGPNWKGLTGFRDVVTFSEMKIRPIV